MAHTRWRVVRTWGVALAMAVTLGAQGARSALAAPPLPGIGYGKYERTIEDLPDIRGALISNDGTVVAALGSGGVVRIAPDGQRSTLIPWWPAGQVATAGAIARLGDDALVVADLPRAQLIAIDREGGRSVLADLALLSSPPRPVALCTEGDRVLVADGAQPRVLVVDAGGTTLAQWAVAAPPGGLPPRLRGITAGGGHVFVSDAANCRIVRLDPRNGAITGAWGDRGTFAGMFETPQGLAWDGGALLVTDTLNHRVVRMDTDGRTIDQWGMHAVRPREGAGKIHYPVTAAVSPDGARVVVAEPFERRAQVFGALPPPDPSAPRTTPLPAFDGVASHFSREIALDGQTLIAFEPESASALVFDLRNDPPIHVTTLGGAGRAPGEVGQISTQLVDERANRIYLVDPVRGVIQIHALRRTGEAPRFDPFMGRLVGEVPLAPIGEFAAQRAGGPATLWPLDIRRTPTGGLALLDGDAPRVVELDSSLRPVNAWAATKGAGRLVAPSQIALLPQGDVVVVDGADRAVKRYGLADGAYKGALPLPESKRPWGIAAFGEGPDARLALTDAGGDSVIVVGTEDGAIRARMSARGDKPGELWEPSGVEYRPLDGRLYVADYGNHRLQSFATDATWESSFGIGRAFVRPRDSNAPQRPTTPQGSAPSAEGAANTLAQFPAAVKQEEGWWQLASTDGKYQVRWRTVPDPVPLRDPFAVEVMVTDRVTGQPSTASLRVDARMPHHHHGMNVAPTIVPVSPGRWRAENMLFHMPGYWDLIFDLVEHGRLERAQGEITLE